MHSEVAAVGRDGIVGRAIDVQGAAWRKVEDGDEPVIFEIGTDILGRLLLVQRRPVLRRDVGLDACERLPIELLRPQRCACGRYRFKLVSDYANPVSCKLSTLSRSRAVSS